jgi:alpha-glucuronidase
MIKYPRRFEQEANSCIAKVAYSSNPVAPIRRINQWDNLDGSITRGYGGLSVFFDQGQVKENLNRVTDYGESILNVQ